MRASLLAWLAALALGLTSAQSATSPELSFRSNSAPPRLSDREVVAPTPARWTAPVGYSDENRMVGVGGGVVVTLWQDTLIGRDFVTGRVLWKKYGYGEGFAVSDEYVAALARTGELLVADVKTGRERWRRKAALSVSDLRWLGGLLTFWGVPFGGEQPRLIGLEGPTGRPRWLSAPGDRLVGREGDLLLTQRQTVSGTPPGFTAWDVASGQRRWRVDAVAYLGRSGNRLDFQRAPERVPLTGGVGTLNLLAVQARSGEEKPWTLRLNFPEVKTLQGASASQVKLGAECAWVGVWANKWSDALQLVGCQRRDGSGPGRQVGTRGMGGARWLGGPLGGRLWFTNGECCVWTGKAANVLTPTFTPHGPGERLSRFDLTGGRAVVASTDGQVLVYHPDRLQTPPYGTVPLVVSRHVTRSRAFGPSVIYQGHLLVQGEGEVQVFPTR
ncbi:PQQ-like domain-containing protein [Deinococcus reticulitermitis]|uniref:PQQ-like domain-containing protein n=1 Tax=Deinococcus reticulitermitis TaxID=856736 RepID=A0A1H6W8S7_9DEIO|nr:PQQ-binding-like beta-propeller repeat protein [Deinococcus reticulitermitis]SEJ13303.1 PQQ-like domain-containing protein [Deinococcus reticulitermitis]